MSIVYPIIPVDNLYSLAPKTEEKKTRRFWNVQRAIIVSKCLKLRLSIFASSGLTVKTIRKMNLE